MANQQDTISFVNAIEIWFGNSSSDDRLFRMSKPLALLFPSFLHLLGIPITFGLLIQQLLSYWLTGWIFYHLLVLVLDDKKQAYIGMLACLLCQPMAVYGLALLVDTLGWACILATVWYALKNKASLHSIKTTVLLGIFLGVGFFVKESIIIAGLFIFYLTITSNHSFIQKIRSLLWIGLSFIFIISIGSWVTWQLWEQTIYHWFLFNENSPPSSSFYYIIQQSYRTIDVYWILVLPGILYYLTNKEKYPLLLPFLLTAITSWLIFPWVWHYHYDRILFMNALFLIPFIPLGAQFLGKMQLPLVLIGGIMNLLVAFAIYYYQTPGLILVEFSLFSLIFIVMSYRQAFVHK